MTENDFYDGGMHVCRPENRDAVGAERDRRGERVVGADSVRPEDGYESTAPGVSLLCLSSTRCGSFYPSEHADLIAIIGP